MMNSLVPPERPLYEPPFVPIQRGSLRSRSIQDGRVSFTHKGTDHRIRLIFETRETRERRRARVVGRRGRLRGVPAQLRRRGRRRRGRSAGAAIAAGLPGRPRRGRHLADPVLPVAAGRRGLRRQRLLCGGSAAGDHGGLRRPGLRRRRAPDPGHHRPGAEPLLQRPPAVPRRAGRRARQRRAGQVHLPRRPRPRRRAAAEQLAVAVRRPRVDPGDRGRRARGSGTCTCTTPASPTGTGTTRTCPRCSRT